MPRGVENVLDAERHASQQAAPAAPVACARRAERLFRVETGPGAHDRIALADAVEAAPDDGLRGQLAGLDQPGASDAADRRCGRRQAWRRSVCIRGAGRRRRFNPAPRRLCHGAAISPSRAGVARRHQKATYAEASRRRADDPRSFRRHFEHGQAALSTSTLIGEAEQPVDAGKAARVQDCLARKRVALALRQHGGERGGVEGKRGEARRRAAVSG